MKDEKNIYICVTVFLTGIIVGMNMMKGPRI